MSQIAANDAWPTWRERHPRLSLALLAATVCLLVSVGSILVIDGLLLGAGSLVGPVVLAWPVPSAAAYALLLTMWIVALPSVHRRPDARAIVHLSLASGVLFGILGFVSLGLWHGRSYAFATQGAVLLSLGLSLAIKETQRGGS